MGGPKTLLIGWDGADWEIARPLMEAGLMSTLARLVADGMSGDMISFSPYLSPMLWTTIATGHHPDWHGVHGFAEVDPVSGEGRAVGTGTRRTKSIWNMVSEQGGSAAVVGWMGSFPAEAIHGAFVADAFGHAPTSPAEAWPVAPGSVYPPELAEELADLRLRAQEVDPGLLGLFAPGLRANVQELAADPHLQVIMQRLAQLYTLQNAAVTLVSQGQPDFFAVYFHFLDLISHEFVVYHPPRHSRVTVAAYERYKDVVNAAYRVQDALLGDLLRHCEPGTSVILVSDHGFKTGALRPARLPARDAGLADWHRREGMVVAHGPGVAKGRLNGVRPVDITPTLLAWRGLPKGDDMPGRVLTEIFVAAPAVATIPTWETQLARVPPPSMPPAVAEADEQKRLTHRFVELGYLDPAVQRGGPGGEVVADENRSNLGRALRDLGRSADALPYLQAAALAEPESPSRAVELGHCLLDLGLKDEAEQAMQVFFDHGKTSPRALLLRAQLLIARRRFPQAAELVEQLAGTELADVCGGLRRYILLNSGRHEAARTAFLTELGRVPPRAPMYLGLAQACLASGRLEEAMVAARDALVLDPGSTDARRLLEEVERCWAAGILKPLPPSWEARTQAARQRAALRTEYRERERVFLTARTARRAAMAAAALAGRERILVVSGAPRSGTSMMMRMLAMAGVPVLTDGARVANPDNPLGYFEWEPVKRLAAEPELIARAEGKALKVVSPLLTDLPVGWNYDVIFMRRDARAILQSQERMVVRSGNTQTRLEASELERHIEIVLRWARGESRVRLIEIDYDELLERPAAEIARLVEFLGPDRIKRVEALGAAMRGELRHHVMRGETSSRAGP